MVASHAVRQLRRFPVQFIRTIGDAVLRKRHGKCPKRVGLDDIDSHSQEGIVHRGNNIGAGDVEHLVAALEVGTPKVVRGQSGALQSCTGRAVEDNHTIVQSVEEVWMRGDNGSQERE